jgi:glycosyltransferase involved in cell wall biosynthesis
MVTRALALAPGCASGARRYLLTSRRALNLESENMGRKMPLVSVGLPTLNGGRWLEETLESLLAQSHTNLEVVVCDNASDDDTGSIARRLAEKDKRIRHVRNQYTVPQYLNFNQSFRLSSGEYFMWAGDHDRWDEAFVERLLEVLEAHPETALAYSKNALIDQEGEVVELYDKELSTEGLAPADRFRTIYRRMTWCYMVFGLYRADHLRRSGLIPRVISGDRVLLCNLGFYGEIRQLPDCLLYLRRARDEDAYEAEQRRIKALYADQRDKWRRLAPHLYMVHEFLESILRSGLSPEDKRGLLRDVMGIAPSKFPYLTPEVTRFMEVCAKALEQDPPQSYFISLDTIEMMKLITLVGALYSDLEGAKELKAAVHRRLAA